MKLFNSIAIETHSKCSRVCWFCPVAYNPRPKGEMSMELIENILKQLGSIEYKGRIELFMYSEPMMDTRMLDIIAMCRELVPKACLMFATNTDFMKSSNQVQKYWDAGLNQMQCNIYSTVPQWRKVLKIMNGTNAVPGTNMFTAISPKKQEYCVEVKFDKKITPDSPKVGNFKLANRSGLIPALPDLVKSLPKMCVRPFRSMQINWKGEVLLCCNDNRGDVIVGNVNDTGVIEVWEDSKVLQEYRQKLLRKDRDIAFCKKCDFDGGSYQFQIPKFWPELVESNVCK